jgi:hypothetical protein
MKQPFENEINDVLKHLMDKLFFVAIPLGAVAITIGIIRSISYGWRLGIAVDAISFSAMIIILALRNRIPVPVTFRLLMGAVAVSGWPGPDLRSSPRLPFSSEYFTASVPVYR